MKSSSFFVVCLMAVFLVASAKEGVRWGNQLLDRPCEEIYVVSEGETLHTISDKCEDPFIIERNPHLHDPDDVFPGLVIKITPSRNRKLLS